MKIFSSCSFVLIVFGFVSSAFSQAVQPTPTPHPADQDVVKITTNLIQLDITVTDKHGNVVRDLKPEEIELFENGKKQKISNFSFISSIQQNQEKAEKKAAGQPGPVLPAAPVKPDQVRRTIALVVDDLTLSFESVYFVRRALKKFVDEQMQDGDLVAIIRTGAGIGALQQFTRDKRQLYAAVDKIRWNSYGTGGISAFAPVEPTPLQEARAAGQRVSKEQLEAEQNRINNQNDFRESVFATGTLGAINYVVRGMQELPGRKSVMLLSDGFKLFTADENGSKESSRIMDSLRRLVDLANRASVVIYTMDARGLQYTGLTAADNMSLSNPDEITQAMSDRADQLFDTQAGLQYLAQQTGGTAIVNNNDLSGGIRKILDDQSYYLVGYLPDEATFDPKTSRFNKIEIKVLRPDARVRYRSGFYGISNEKRAKPAMTPAQQMMNALTSPFAVNDISLRLNALFGNESKTGSYIQSFVHIRAQDLTFTDEADGTKKAVFDIIAMGFGDNGIPVDQLSKTYTMTVKKDMLDRLLKNGFVYYFAFPIKKPGAYQLRLALRDSTSNKVGSASQFVDVPNLKKNRLTLSGVVLENMTLADWKKREASNGADRGDADSLNSSSLRQFKRGTILNYGFAIYNAKNSGPNQADLTTQVKLYRDGKMIFEGKPQPIPMQGQTDPRAISFVASLVLGTSMGVGDYVMQITVTDNLASEKHNSATQFVQFEIVE